MFDVFVKVVDFPARQQLVPQLNLCHLRDVLCNDFIFFSFEIAMMFLLFFGFIRGGQVGMPVNQEEVICLYDILFYQELASLSTDLLFYRKSAIIVIVGRISKLIVL